ncbi:MULTISPECIES: hypothetical protein [unclassified Pseudomonas]|uniref:hypothetical protein n=1 Tax=unclassified Pseudomonas TaxID=196821 RepID=UPI0015A25464|nr:MULTISPECIES: hypothetical protein [unclassified Pseudomonas]NWC92252.1 hypothetical protein [Pseudomonas sp. IPO3779]NWD20194.1 hypothetical protein [Pseudomonas sp. IPO3778]
MPFKRCLSRLWVASFICVVGTPAFAATLHSGTYEGLMLAVTPAHQVEGFYAEAMGEGVTRTCTFFLQGQVDGAKASVSTWLDATYPGTVAASSDGVTLTVEKGREHPGCISVLMPEIATGLDLTQTAAKKWIGLVTVSSDKAFLQKTPDAKASHRAYVVKDDVVAVLAFKDGWAQVEFINAEGRSSKGWISQDQYASLAPKG